MFQALAKRLAPALAFIACVSLGFWAAVAAADDYPSKPIRLIVPYSAGTPPDILSRLVAESMANELGQPMVIDNKPGATGTVGLSEFSRQPPDGYTVMDFLSPMTAVPALYPSMSLDLWKALEPVGQFSSYCQVLVVTPSLKATSVRELIADLKAKPDTFAFASGGNGTPAHLSGELFKSQVGVSATHVPYNQFMQGITDVMAGRVQFMFLTSSVAIPYITADKMRALAVTGPRRLASLPNVPTMVEEGFPDFVVCGWDGFVVRPGTPKNIVARLNAALGKAITKPKLRDRFAELGVEPVNGTPEDFRKLIDSEITRWGNVIKASGIKAD